MVDAQVNPGFKPQGKVRFTDSRFSCILKLYMFFCSWQQVSFISSKGETVQVQAGKNSVSGCSSPCSSCAFAVQANKLPKLFGHSHSNQLSNFTQISLKVLPVEDGHRRSLNWILSLNRWKVYRPMNQVFLMQFVTDPLGAILSEPGRTSNLGDLWNQVAVSLKSG